MIQNIVLVCWLLFLENLPLHQWRGQSAIRQPINPCDIYGIIYEEKDRRRAQFLVYIEPENEYRANLTVFKEINSTLADNKGLWYFTETRGFADYAVHFVEDRAIADFIIYYTEKPHYAGCR
jgi:hypothetical protein